MDPIPRKSPDNVPKNWMKIELLIVDKIIRML